MSRYQISKAVFVSACVRPERLLRRLVRGELANVRYSDFARLVRAYRFRLSRTSGSPRIFVHPAITELLNVQDVRGEVKPYQTRQFLRLIERYNLLPEDES